MCLYQTAGYYIYWPGPACAKALKAGGVKEGEVEAGNSRREAIGRLAGRARGHGDSQETAFGMTLGWARSILSCRSGPYPSLLSAVLEARVRQLRAEGTPEMRVKKVQVDRPPQDRSSRWAQKLEAEKRVKQRRQEEADQQKQAYSPESWTLHREPKIWNKKLAGYLPQSKKGTPTNSEEKQLARALQAALGRLSSREAEALARKKAKVVEAQILVLQQKLLAFFECCVCTSQVPLAHHVLVTHHNNGDKQQVLTLHMYNTVMLGWARKVRPGPRAASFPRGTFL